MIPLKIIQGVVNIYSLMLVDDEKLILKNIATGFNWEEMGFELKATFTSAKTALAWLEGNEIDFIISDVKMPIMDGLEFAKIVSQKYPDVKFAVLSAFQDFDYVRKALSIGVFDYILKPVTFSKISELLIKAKEAIDKQKALFPIHYNKKHKIISDVLNKKLTDLAEIERELKKEGIHIDENNTHIVLVRVSVCNFDDFLRETWSYDINQFHNAFSFIIEQDDSNIIVSKNGYGYVEVLVLSDGYPEDDFLKTVNNKLCTISDNCFEILNCHTEFDVLRVFSNIKELINTNDSGDIAHMYIRQLIDFIVAGNVVESLDYIEKRLALPVWNVETLSYFLQCLVIEVNNYARTSKPNADALQMPDIFNESHLNIIKDTLKSFVEKAAVYFSAKNSYSQNFIDDAKRYIKENYDKDILLSDIANAVFISESHLSRTFKIKTGESIISYLNKVRLRHAQELLISSSMNVEDICLQVGYKSRNLFYKNFKDEYGITPKKYRSENKNGE